MCRMRGSLTQNSICHLKQAALLEVPRLICSQREGDWSVEPSPTQGSKNSSQLPDKRAKPWIPYLRPSLCLSLPRSPLSKVDRTSIRSDFMREFSKLVFPQLKLSGYAAKSGVESQAVNKQHTRTLGPSRHKHIRFQESGNPTYAFPVNPSAIRANCSSCMTPSEVTVPLQRCRRRKILKGK